LHLSVSFSADKFDFEFFSVMPGRERLRASDLRESGNQNPISASKKPRLRQRVIGPIGLLSTCAQTYLKI
jgi:hypothetical protein